MKFMSRKNLAEETGISQLSDDEGDKSSFYWMLIGFAIIIGILLLGVLTLAIIPNRVSEKPNNSSNSSTLKQTY